MSLPPCPICAKPADPHYRPFCSKRCADLDLQRWFTGGYAIPAGEGEADPGPDPARDPARDPDEAD